MGNVPQEKKPAQAKTKNPFVVREIPSETFLDPRLRGSAHQVLGLFWIKADATTGELRIGPHWFEQHELVRSARKLGISERTFRNVLHDQLIPCGYVKELPRVLVPHTDASGRNRKVFDSKHYVVFKTSQEPHGQRKIRKAKSKQQPTEQVSTSGKILPVEENAPPLGDSSSGQNHQEPEKGSTTGNSTTVVHLPDNTYSKAPNSADLRSAPLENIGDSGGVTPLPPPLFLQKAPLAKAGKDWETLPGWNLIDLTPSEKQELAQDSALVATWLEVAALFEALGHKLNDFFLAQLFENVYQRLTKAGHKVSATFIEAKIRAKKNRARFVKEREHKPIEYLKSEYGPIKERDPETQAAFRQIYNDFLKRDQAARIARIKQERAEREALDRELDGLSYDELDAIDKAPPFKPNRTARQKLARWKKMSMRTAKPEPPPAEEKTLSPEEKMNINRFMENLRRGVANDWRN